jgi:hypothetical protein
MPRKPNRETTVERIYREVTGQKMPQSVKRILLHKAKFKLKPLLAQQNVLGMGRSVAITRESERLQSLLCIAWSVARSDAA